MFTKLFAILVHTFTGESSLIKTLQKTQQQRADYWILQNMTDKDLRDIGITRGEINSKVYGGKTT
jgi:uncharacterized protein YjiS (DUF1127 family)